MARTNSDSTAQRAAEPELLGWLSAALKCALKPTPMQIGDVSVVLDGFGEDAQRIVLVEIYARIGKLKGGQPDKVLSDVLKLCFVRQHLACKFPTKRIEAHYVFADEVAASVLKNKSWGAAAAAKLADIQVHVAALAEATRASVLAAQQAQDIRT